jgi:hypothetical protein
MVRLPALAVLASYIAGDVKRPCFFPRRNANEVVPIKN